MQMTRMSIALVALALTMNTAVRAADTLSATTIASSSVSPAVAPVVKPNAISVSSSVSSAGKSSLLTKIRANKVTRVTRTRGKEVSVEYPQFVGDNKLIIDRLNQLVKRAVNTHMPSGEASTVADYTYTYSCEYSIHHLSPELVSVSLYFYSFTGGAHGNGFSVPFNYKLTAAGPKEITLQNLFGVTPDVSALRKMIRPQLIEQLYPDYTPAKDELAWLNTGTSTMDDFSDISIDGTGITFNFQSYQVACYAAGAPSIKLTFSELRRLFTVQSPIATMAYR